MRALLGSALCGCVCMALVGCGDGETPGNHSGAASAAETAPSSSGAPRAKRVGPPKVPPVTIGNVRFEALHWAKERGLGQNGGYIAAFDAKSGTELWTLKVYDVRYEAQLEPDVQDVFIKSMAKSLFGSKLNVTDERGRQFVVDVEKRSVEPR